MFFSGPGGTGKTVVLQEILKFFRWRYYTSHSEYLRLGHACACFACNVAITAPTGIAGEVLKLSVQVRSIREF